VATSTSGIGKAAAIKMSKRGAHVLVVGRNEERGGAVVDAIRAGGAGLIHSPSDHVASQVKVGASRSSGRVNGV
jgi:3-oxoacyl-[acyl-carrier protein] reductase